MMNNYIHNERLYFWKQQNNDVTGMMCNPDAAEFETFERAEIISYLPDLKEKQVLEPAAGIGRFTVYFASVAKHVTAVDFVDEFIEKNKKACFCFSNTTHHVGNVMELNFKNASFDFVFINWLLMYLEDVEVRTLCDRIYQWLKPNGLFFLRESCVSASNPNRTHPHTYYRNPNFYIDLFITKYRLLSHGNIRVYEQKYQNPYQLWWLYEKI
ncbi:MAG: methyltransferase domain-containing protein [Deltaproteobacteria bacterium]|nr:methyltransferase domain-containing protein [Deltaproteobacteria bacterium]